MRFAAGADGRADARVFERNWTEIVGSMKILIVADEPGWVFERHALEIKKRLPQYQIDVAYKTESGSKIREMSDLYDLVYVMDPLQISHPDPRKTIMGLRCEFYYLEAPGGVMGFYEHGYPPGCASVKHGCCIFHVVNMNQMRVFKGIVTDKPLFLAQHGVDEEIFDRSRYQRVPNDKLVASISGRETERKGFHLIREACESAGVKYVSAQYGTHKLTKEQMPEFYSKVDVHICMSSTEGINNPTMEAGAMGVPVISTRSGAAEEMIRDGISGLLIDRTVPALVNALEKMKDAPLRHSMGEMFHEEIMKNWTWRVKIDDFRKMFEYFFYIKECNQ